MRRHAGYTLLEVILAMSLAVVVLGLVGVGIHVHVAVAAKSSDQVKEAQVARALLQRIADDLRNAVPFQPPRIVVLVRRTSAARLPRRALPAWPLHPALRIPAAPRIRAAPRRFPAASTARPRRFRSRRRDGRGQPWRRCRRPPATPARRARLSDIRIVSYGLGAPVTVDMSQQTPPSTSATGLYRHEQDRAAFYFASQTGQIDDRPNRQPNCLPRKWSISSSPTTAARPARRAPARRAAERPAAARRAMAQRAAARRTPTRRPTARRTKSSGIRRKTACCPSP